MFLGLNQVYYWR